VPDQAAAADRAARAGAARFTARWAPDVRSIGATAWRTVSAGRRLYLGWEWLGAFAGHGNGLSRVAVVEDGTGVLAGALPCLVAPSGLDNPLYNLFDLFGAAAGLPESDRESWSPQLLGGGSAGYAGGVLVRPDLPPGRSREVAALLLGKVAELAAEAGCRSSALLYLDRDDAALARSVLGDGGGTPLLTSASAWLPVTWRDHSGYLRALRPSRRSVVRRGVSAFERSGCRIERGTLSPQIDTLAPLLTNVQQRHGHPATTEIVAYYLAQCSWNGLDELSVVFLARRGDDPVAFSLGYEVDGTLEMRVVGLDYERTGRHDEYFTVLFDEPVRYAAEHGLTRIEYGVEAFRAKLLRGCLLRPLWSVLTLGPAGPGWPGALAGWNAREYERWQRDYGRLAGGLAEDDWTLG
jgi:uncharacterized protein